MARPAVRRIPPLRTRALESTDELRAFRQALSQRRSLPRMRIALRISGLPEGRSQVHERRINHLLMATGYREGLAQAALLAGASLVWPLPPAADGSWVGYAVWVAQVFLACVLGWHVGRFAGIARVRHQLRRACDQVGRELSQRNPA